MTAIAAIDENLAIGYKGNLLFRLPLDLKHYKEETIGKVIVMGRKTVEGLPNKRPLPGRTTIIVSHRFPLPQIPEDAIICGGEAIYKLFFSKCDTLILTEVKTKAKEADVFFPEYRENFTCIKDSGEIQDNGYIYNIRTYIINSKNK